MASDTARITVQFFGRDRTLGKSFRDQMKAADTFGKKMTLVGTRLKSMGRAMTTGVTMPVVAGLALATKSASDLGETVNKVNVVFGKQATTILKWSKSASTSIGMSRQQALEALGTFGNLFKTMGVGDAEAARMSKKMTELAADLASFHNIAPEEALEKLRSGLVGEAEPMRQVGVLLSETAVKEKAYAMGLAKKGDELTEQQKVAARYALIMEQTTKAQGDFGRTSNGLANRTRILKAQFKDVAAQLGTVLIPFVQKAAGWATQLIKKFTGLSKTQRELIVKVGLAAAALGPLLMIFGQVLIMLPKIKAGLIAMKAGFAMMTGPVGIVIAAVAALVAIFVILYKKNETFRNAVNAVWGFVKKYISMAVGAVIDRLRAWWNTMKTVASVAKSAFGKVKDAVRAVADFIGKVWKTIARCLNLAFAPLRTAIDWAQKLFGWLGKVSERSASTRATGGRPAITTTTHHGGRGGQYGGIFSGPTSGYPVTMHGTEAIVPLARDRAADAARVLAAAGLLGGGNTVVNVYLDSEPIAARVEVRQAQRARRYARTVGAPA